MERFQIACTSFCNRGTGAISPTATFIGIELAFFLHARFVLLPRALLRMFQSLKWKERAMKKWVDPAYCDLRLGFEVTAYVYVR